MAKVVVTSGPRFTDLDALASAIAYGEIPPEPPLVVLPGPLNQSISKEIRRWSLNFETNVSGDDYDFVIVDVSELEAMPLFVRQHQDRVVEIYDHHFGFEELWREKLGERAKIEEVGACATLIWEEMKRRKLEDRSHACRQAGEKLDIEVRSANPKISPPTSNSSFPLPTSHFHISPLAANLLYTAIISNSLNLHSPLTTDRDRKALEELKPFTNLPQNWISQYYLDLEREIYLKPEVVIRNDTKVQNIKGMQCAFCQLELWNSRDFLREYGNRIEAILKEYGTQAWLFNSPCLNEGRNYLYTKNEVLKNLLRRVMTITFEGNIGVTNKLWLRKEILRLIQ